MIRPIMRDIFFLQQKSEKATKQDAQVIVDLLDTLASHYMCQEIYFICQERIISTTNFMKPFMIIV